MVGTGTAVAVTSSAWVMGAALGGNMVGVMGTAVTVTAPSELSPAVNNQKTPDKEVASKARINTRVITSQQPDGRWGFVSSQAFGSGSGSK